VKELRCTLILMRHAAAEGAGRFQGQRDTPLSARGRRQLAELAPKLSKYRIQTVYSSDLSRARATAAAAGRKFGLKLETRPGLREMNFGCWQGLPWGRIAKRYPRLADLWVRRFPNQVIPGAEHFDDFRKRVEEELRDLVSANEGRCVLVVTHAGVIRVALASALGMPQRNLFRLGQDPCAINVIDHFQDGVLVRCVNG
jgi:broad specificity phosphatase PhoE